MIRTFIGVRVASDPGDALEQWIQTISPSIDAKRWYNTQQFHITLHFLGNQTEQQLMEIDEICRQVAKNCMPFGLSLHSLGMFERSRVVWAGVEGDIAKLQTLYKKLWPVLKVADCEAGARPKLAAHITLGRLRTVPSKPDFQKLQEQIAGLDVKALPAYAWKVLQIERFESVSTPNGVQYPTRAVYSLG